MQISEAIRGGRFCVTCELTPPKGTSIQGFLNAADMVRNYADAILVTDNQRAVMRAAPLILCQVLKSRNIEPVMEICIRDHNRLALQSQLLGAAIAGVENVLVVAGHDVLVGDHIDAKPVNDMSCSSLVQAAVMLNQGKDLAGHNLEGSPRFSIGIEAIAEKGLKPDQVADLREKVAQGAQYIITQPVYEPETMAAFVESVSDLNVPILVSHIMLRSASMARFMNSNFPGVNVPDYLIRELEGLSREEVPAASVQLSIDLLRRMKPLCQGMHLMPGGWERYVPRIVDGVA